MCAELFYRFIDAMASNKGYIDTTLPVHIDSYGNRYVTVEVSTVYVKDGKLHVGDEVLELPAVLVPEKDIKPEAKCCFQDMDICVVNIEQIFNA